LVLAVVGALAALGLIAPATAAAAGTPDISLGKTQPAQALLGTDQLVTLTAGNTEAGTVPGYNLTFRDVLPAGVNYVGGSASPAIEPQILHNAPAPGETTLIFHNVSDLSPRSYYTLTFEVEPTSAVYNIGQSYEDQAEAFVNEEPRFEPKFDAQGRPLDESTSYTGSAEDAASTTLTAVEIEKIEPLYPEHELLRGVHEQQTVYTLLLRNNKVGPTKNLAVDDYLPAGLEFLGCGSVDHTTKTATNEGGVNPAEEYPGSGAIFPGNHPAAPACLEPTLVETESVDPPGPQPSGVYTHVVWEGLGELGPGQKKEIQYRAAVPILRNTLNWTNGKPVGALTQAANLDNNTGEETEDEEALTNVAQVKGKYEGTLDVEDADELTVTAEDIAIQKDVTPTTISNQQISEWTFHIETSEYRYAKNVRIDDTLPNGLCPLGAENFEGPTIGAATEPKTECDHVPGKEPEVIGPSVEPAPYTSVEELPTGEFKLHWDESSVPSLALMPPSTEVELVFPTRTRTDYQENYEDKAPVLTGDHWSNEVKLLGADYARCTPDRTETCDTGGAPIFHDEVNGEDDKDESSAEQKAGTLKIDKSVRQNDGLEPVNCEGTYVDGLTTMPRYRPGDEVCWQLKVEFDSNLFSGEPVVTDFLPPGQRFIPGSVTPGPANTVTAVPAEGEAAAGILKWTLNSGEAVEFSNVFEWRFSTEMLTSATEVGDISGNLMKFSYANTEGETFPLRDRAEVVRLQPELALEKGITEFEGKIVIGEPKSSVTVGGGKKVKFQLKVKNAGELDAEEVEVWDVLPKQITCTDVTLPTGAELPASTAISCAEGTIKWTNVPVPEEGENSVEYEVVVPTGVSPGFALINHTGVRSYKSPTNTGGKYEYFPAENIDKSLTESNTKPLLDQAEIKTTAATLKKEATTETTQLPGNEASQATIGEIVDYKVTAMIPANSKIYGTPVLKDVLPAGIKLVGTPAAELDGHPLEFEGVTIVPVTNGAEVLFNAAFPGTVENKAHTVVLNLKGRVENIPVNKAGVTIKNKATFEFENVEAEGTTTLKKEAETPLVEPKLEISKKPLSNAGSSIVEPGEVVEYETDVTNSGSSTANEVSVEDTAPPGMEVADPGVGIKTSSTTIKWHIATIGPGATKQLFYKLRVVKPAAAASSFTNKAVATTQSLPNEGGESGPTPAEARTSTATAGIAGYEAEAENTVRLIGATVSKEVTPEDGTIGSFLTYKLHMNLPPEIKFFNTTMVDLLPEGVTYVKTLSTECTGEGCAGPPESEREGTEHATENVPGGTLVGWEFGTFEHGKARELVVEFEAFVNAEAARGDELKNKLAGVYDETPISPPPANLPTPGSHSPEWSEETNIAEATTNVHEPELELTKSVAGAAGGAIAMPGEPLTYTLKVTNNGDWPAYDFAVNDVPGAHLVEITPGSVGPGITPPSTGTPSLIWHVDGPLEEGESIELTYTAKLAESKTLKTGDQVKNTAEIPTYFGLTPTEQATAKVKREYPKLEAKKQLEVELPLITLEKTSGKPSQADGEEVDVNEAFPWRIVVGNEAANAGAKEAVVKDGLPTNWTYKSGSATVGGTATAPTIAPGNPQVLTWTLPTLAAAGEVEILFEATPGPEAVTVPGLGAEANVNKAVVHAKDLSGAEEGETGPYEADDVANATLVAPKFEVKKTPDGDTAIAGEEVEYKIEVTNIGNGKASEPIEVDDELSAEQEFVPGATLPTGVTQVSPNPPPGVGPAVVSWTIASLEPGESVIIPVPVRVPSSDDVGSEIQDIAKVKSPQAPTVKEDPAHFVIDREADVGIEKESTPTSVNGGEKIDYTLTVKNHGPSDATGVTVTDEIPAGTTFIKATEPACGLAAGEVTCIDPLLEAGHEVVFHVEVEVETGRLTPIFNTAEVTRNETDNGPDNDHATVETTIGGSADLLINKTGPSRPVLLGNTFTYKLEVENLGPSNATDVEVEDELPAEVEFLEATEPPGTTCAEAGGTLTCELGTLLPHSPVVVIEVTVKALALPAAGGKTVNTAEVDSPTPDPETENNHSTAETEILPAADLAITKTASPTAEPNGELTYHLHVENLGPSTAHEVKVSDPLPAGTTFVSAGENCEEATGVVFCAPLVEGLGAGELEVGEAVDFQVTVQVPFALAGRPLTNTASVTAEEGDPHTENNSSTVTTNVGPAADLSITKTMGKAQAGLPLTYTLAITNHGPSASSAVTVKDSLPAGTSFKSAAPSQGTCSASGQTVICQLGQLASGGSAQVSITVEVAATVTGSLRNVATVEGPEPDPDRSNNESSVEGPVDPAPPAAPNLKVTKTANTSSPQVGTPFEYHVTVANMSGAEAKRVKVLDTLNGPVKVLSIEADSGHCEAAGSKISCTIPSIPVGKTVHITYSVVAEATGNLSNTASAQAANGEVAPANNHAVKSVKAKAAALGTFKLTKTASRKVVPGGKKVGFTITLRNGSTALVNAKVCDRLPSALVFVKAAGARYLNGEACWKETFVAAHKVLRLHLMARAVKGYKSRQARNVATASAENAVSRTAAATVRIKPAFAGAPGGVTG
jgi:uncharacterized repeat protein (TIGR01451 family)/fimbrial isopeptide formation D2 family protein